jgi:acetyl esterase/lipase
LAFLLLGCGDDTAPQPLDGGMDDASVDAATDGLESVGIVTNCEVPDLPDGGIQLATDVLYATMDGQELRLDVAWPSAPGTHPLVVAVHGGGWYMLDKTLWRRSIQILAGQGYVAASVDYRLAMAGCDPDGGVLPDAGTCHPNHFPAAVQDVRCAVRWLRANAATYSIDPTRVAAMGDSAGGNLASMIGVTTDVTGLDAVCPVGGDASVDVVVPFYGPEDFFNWDPTFPSAEDVARFLGTASYNSDPMLAKLASPIYHVTPQSPPYLMLHGTADHVAPYPQSVAMRAALHAAGVPATLVTLPGVDHAFPPISPLPQFRTSTCTMLAFLQQRLRP